MEGKRRVGIFGGTFNPPHIAHVNAAECFIREMKLDKLLIIPAYLPPHKELAGSVSAEDRLNMTRLAFSHIGGVEISDMEIKRGGKSYTVHTLEELFSEECELYLLIGTDMLLSFDRWYMPERIFSLASVCYVRRECDAETTELISQKCDEYKKKYGARIYSVPCEVIEFSSTELRDGIRTDSDVLEMIPPSVLQYITERNLYYES